MGKSIYLMILNKALLILIVLTIVDTGRVVTGIFKDPAVLVPSTPLYILTCDGLALVSA